ncbi:MAG: aldo/keto reductase [Anaerolineales bacterium]|nr:aldo/keto reductase [Anaerolineales bacterium]
MTDLMRKLGHTDITISPIGLGAWQFSNYRFGPFSTWQPVETAEIDGIIAAALARGVNWFDTAELYGFGRSERALSAGLKRAGKPNGSVRIASKWSPILRTARSIESTIYTRIAALAPYDIDLYQIHFPGALASVESQMDAMANLVKASKIRSIGVSNFSAEQMRAAHMKLQKHGLALSSNQVHYSLLNRSIESNGVLQTARELGVTIIAYSPLEMGLLTGKFHENPNLLNARPLNRRRSLRRMLEASRPLIEHMRPIARRYEASIAQVALNWLIHVPGSLVAAIPGATKIRHAEDSAGAMAFQLSQEEWMELDAASRAIMV